MAVLRGNEARYFLARLRQARTDSGPARAADATPDRGPARHDCDDAGTPPESPAAGPE